MSYLRKSWLRPLVLSGDMLRNRGLVLLTIFNLINQLTTNQIIYTDGWIPMSQVDIYNQIRREYPVHPTMKPLVNNDINLNVVQRQINTKKDFRTLKENSDLLIDKLFDGITIEDTTNNNDLMIVNSKETTRKAKKVWDHDIDIDMGNILALPESNSVINEENTTNDVIPATSNTYEVTEDTDTSLTPEDNTTTDNVGYQYEPPTDQSQNLTSTFYKILSKYNINTDDKLQNYDLSLQHKVQNPSKNAYGVPLPYRFNSLNHLPVDPLLAVFLSNYGFYLPSLYGIKANYNNLYGYLASNNIHNNKPFGLYKIFSDTDSWN